MTTSMDGTIDITEGLGITLPKANLLEILIIPRLASILNFMSGRW